MKFFTGTFLHAVDAKNRVSVPRKLLEVLRRHDAGSQVVLTRGLDGCLFLYPPDEFERISASVEAAPVGEQTNRDFARTFFGNAEACSVDKNGRLLLPEALKAQVGIGDKVVFAGVGRRVELWSPPAWDERPGANGASYEEQAKDLFR